MNKFEELIGKDKYKEMCADFSVVYKKLEDISRDPSSNVFCHLLDHMRIQVEIKKGGRSPRVMEDYALWIQDILLGSHCTTKKAYSNHILDLHYYVSPDWPYWLGDKYLSGKDWVCPPPPPGMKV